METINPFNRAIKKYLEKRAFEDALFADCLKKKNKSLSECCDYIINSVQKTGRKGFEDEEIYKLAVHYYQEDDIVAEKAPPCTVVVNQEIELTQEEIDEAKRKAVEDVYNQKKSEMIASKRKNPQAGKPEEKELGTLFD